MENRTPRSMEGALCAVLAGIAGQYVGYVVFRLFQLFRDWLFATVSGQPRALDGMPAGMVLVPPPHIWSVAAIAGALIGATAYWIHTLPLDQATRKRRRRWFNLVVLLAVILVGRGIDFVADWRTLLPAVDDLVSLAAALWITWKLVGFSDVLSRRLGT